MIPRPPSWAYTLLRPVTFLVLPGADRPTLRVQGRPALLLAGLAVWSLATVGALGICARHLTCAEVDRERLVLREQRERLSNEVRRLATAYAEVIRTLPRGLPAEGRVTSAFGARSSPRDESRREFHEGVDIANAAGTPVVATADGVVARAGWHGGYGRRILLRHASGLATLFGHAARLLVRPGESVRRGQTVALMGTTGRSTGPHVHYEVLVEGRAVNPARFTQ